MTRAQASGASAALCRDVSSTGSGPASTSGPRDGAPHGVFPAGRQPDVVPAELFGQLFPDGVQMTGELLADLEQWARLTGKLAARGRAGS